MANGDFTKEDRERLVRVEDAVANLCKEMDKFVTQASSEQGFARCAARSVMWDEVKKHQDKVDNFITWFYRGVVGVVGLAVLTGILSHWHQIITFLSIAGVE